MRFPLLAVGAASALLLSQAGAMAQTATAANQPNAAPPNGHTSDQNTPTLGSLRNQVRDMLQKEGFTDIHVMPSSLMIRATDKDGNPVVMSVSPDFSPKLRKSGLRVPTDRPPREHLRGPNSFQLPIVTTWLQT